MLRGPPKKGRVLAPIEEPYSSSIGTQAYYGSLLHKRFCRNEPLI